MISKSLKNRIAKVNKYIAWAQENDILGAGYFGSTFPMMAEYTHPITVSRDDVVTVRYRDVGPGGPETLEKYDLKDDWSGDTEDDLRYEMKTHIVKAIKNGAELDGLRLPSFK
jgi:hypothetical protein